jgi:aldehyde dehydrogenase (NAD+)
VLDVVVGAGQRDRRRVREPSRLARRLVHRLDAAIANQTTFGRSSALFSGDVGRGTRFALGMQAGMAHVNDQPVNDLANNPFGGEKNSGIGQFGGEWAVAAFTTDESVTIQHVPRRDPRNADAPR